MELELWTSRLSAEGLITHTNITKPSVGGVFTNQDHMRNQASPFHNRLPLEKSLD